MQELQLYSTQLAFLETLFTVTAKLNNTHDAKMPIRQCIQHDIAGKPAFGLTC